MAPALDNARSGDEFVGPTRRLIHPLAGSTPLHWFKLVAQHHPLDAYCLPTLAITSALAAMNIIPQAIDRAIIRRRVRKVTLHKPPLFVIGHWRSGTTFMHELLACDPNLAAVTMWQTMSPTGFLVSPHLKHVFSPLVPNTRPMDNMPLGLDRPFEEEAALAALGDLSFYHCFHFARTARRHFRRAVLLEGLTPRQRRRFADTFMLFARRVALAADPRQRLVLKNPANTARIELLLELFPGARFICLHRDPCEVYLSALRMRIKVTEQLALQRTTRSAIEQHVLHDYRALMGRYLKTRHLIPGDHLVELRYEAFTRDPLEHLRRAYTQLGLDDFETARPAMRRHLDARADYRPARYAIDAATRRRVDDAWGDLIRQMDPAGRP